MSDVIGRGTIEVAGDTTKLRASMEEGKRSIKSLGDTSVQAGSKASASIDRFIVKLGQQNAMLGMTTREMELYKLSMRGASELQLKAADNILKMNDAYAKGAEIGNRIRTGFIAIAAASVTLGVAAVYATGRIIEQVASYQDLSEKIGDTATNVASLKLASDISGVAMDTIAAASIKLTAALSKTDDESKTAGAAIKALGLNFADFKKLPPTEQLTAVAKAMDGFADGSEKTAVAVALFGKSGAEIIPFLNELAANSEHQTKLTKDQIKASDEFSKSTARLSSEFESFLQLVVADALPALNDIKNVIASIATDQDMMATASTVLKGALSAGIVVFQTIAVLGANVAFVFGGVKREIVAIGEQLIALAHLDFSRFNSISEAVRADAEKARKELDRFTGVVMAIGEPDDPANYSNEGRNNPQPPKPTLNTSGLVNKTKANNAAAQAAKAQLAADLASIRNTSDAILNTYSNAEKIMQAQRAAGILDEREYYDAKLAMLRLNSSEQDRELQKEISRMQAENLTGKAKIDNDRKIADAQTKLGKLREDAAANTEVLSIQEQAALSKIAQGYRDSEDAAQSYLDTIKKAQARDLAGLGAGSEARNQMAGRAQIEDKYTQQRQDIEKSRRDSEFAGTFGTDAQKKYDDELDRIRRFQATALDEYDKYTDARLKKEGDWTVGATEALRNYQDNAANVAGQIEDLFGNAARGLEDAWANFVTTGKLSFTDLATSVIADIARMQAKAAISGLFSFAISAISGGGSGGGDLGAAYTANAKGGVYTSPSLSDYSNSIVSTPTMFAFAKGAGLMGEAGPEAILPLTRTAGGALGVQAIGGANAGGIQVNVYVQQDGTSSVEAPPGLQQFGRELGDFVDARIGRAAVKSAKQGGQFWNMQNA
jgi:lambda family phage tail tape measure protein